MKITAVQADFTVGAIEANTQKIIDTCQQGESDLWVFPELCLCGYPPEDLLLRPELYQRIHAALRQLCENTVNTSLIVSYPMLADYDSTSILQPHSPKAGADVIYNQAAVIHQGRIIARYNKQCLPNYAVFDERRYFTAGSDSCVFELNGKKLGLLVCEDLWFSAPAEQTKAQGAELLICINASPFDVNKLEQRTTLLQQRSKEIQLPIIYVNCVGGQDELVFDGGSMSCNAEGKLLQQANAFEEDTLVSELTDRLHASNKQDNQPPTRLEQIYKALVLGVRDYVNKNGFPGVILGLSGGIDSALTLAIAADALGADRVKAVMMPSRYTADMSLEDAELEANTLGVDYRNINISPMVASFTEALSDSFTGLAADTTEQNIQARIRGTLLMALSNKFGDMVLTTGNKSELAMGYATLYGDMAGGFCALKNVPKTLVYELSSYRNSIAPVIPQRVIDRPPSAELAPDQKDQDSLPPYDVLDAIIERYIEQDQSEAQIVAAGFDKDTVKQVAKAIQRNEYKRRQAPPGTRLSPRAFGKDRRYPITSGF